MSMYPLVWVNVPTSPTEAARVVWQSLRHPTERTVLKILGVSRRPTRWDAEQRKIAFERHTRVFLLIEVGREDNEKRG